MSKDKNQGTADAEPIIIKKYANRRLYNTATSSYVTLDYLSDMVRADQDFVVYDAKSGEDITRSVLTQIIFEQENKGENLLPVKFLRELIGYYGGNMQSFVPSYLEASMETFSKNQQEIQKSMSEAFSANPGMKMFEDITRQNMAMFEKGMEMFGLSQQPVKGSSQGHEAQQTLAEAQEIISSLQNRIEELEKQLARTRS